ncbi:uncharacterized protein LOC120085717 isoform X2 [Benincasa hispida]|uniref:uncharacterized protein LOC120085717 isoform X2 n=1 Tax=Benincasa hispida TaxID=102211 RepID=UPI0018FF9C1B|nr:uncharacterized protein LOC120085717 isoform X2 [Benincasa hispida]
MSCTVSAKARESETLPETIRKQNPQHTPSPSLYKQTNENTHLEELEISMEKTAQKLRTIHLFCPSLSTIAPFLASDDHGVDIGSIAAIFGLDPSSLKLNGHFLSRGLDLVSCVTWNSLLSFFSTKRLPIGSSDNDALLVDGKLSKLGVKRAHGHQEIVSGDCCKADEEDDNVNVRIKPESNLVKNKKMKYMDLGFDELSDGGVSDAANVAQWMAYSCSFNSNMKRMREEETLVSALCKRSR